MRSMKVFKSMLDLAESLIQSVLFKDPQRLMVVLGTEPMTFKLQHRLSTHQTELNKKMMGSLFLLSLACEECLFESAVTG